MKSSELYQTVKRRGCVCGQPDATEMDMGGSTYVSCGSCGRSFTLYHDQRKAEQNGGEE